MRAAAAVSLLALSANGSMYTSGPAGSDGFCAPEVGQYSTLSASGANSAKQCSDACDQVNNEQPHHILTDNYVAFSRIEAANDGDVDCICQYDFDQQFNEFTTLGGSFFEGKNGYVHKTDDTPGVKCYIVLVSEYSPSAESVPDVLWPNIDKRE
mmetsp:Transcript_30161/g.68017  ORF Transcript_30161/g.68017 Transcript_30161/m.68017 type:complete len:154 (-) Transcript_30161:1515-1976(-)